MISFELKIENLGKIRSKSIQIKPFTLFAGKNNSGKSFASKTLYSFLDVINVDDISILISDIEEKIKDYIEYYDIRYSSRNDRASNADKLKTPYASLHVSSQSLDNFYARFKDIEKNIYPIFETLKGINYNATGHYSIDFLERMQESLKGIVKNLASLKEETEKHDKSKLKHPLIFRHFSLFTDFIKDIKESIESLIVSLKDKENLLYLPSKDIFKESILQNFQVKSISNLVRHPNDESNPASIYFKDLSGVNIFGIIFGHDGLEFKFNKENSYSEKIEYFRDLTTVLFIESPIYLKLKNVLEAKDYSSRRLGRLNTRIIGVPRYVYEFFNVLRIDEIKSEFVNLAEKISKNLGGNIVVNELGAIMFKEKGEPTESYPISLTALGVANLGIIALLLEKGVIKKNSCIFIDEPEVNLHPSWQIVLMEVLCELAMKGVYVVISTHSLEITKYLEIESKKEEFANILAVNHFSDSVEIEKDNVSNNVKFINIKKELTEPYTELYFKGI